MSIATSEWKPNATFKEAPEKPFYSPLVAAIKTAIATGKTLQVLGGHGLGKTSTAMGIPSHYDVDVDVIRINAANLTPDEMLINAPVKLITPGGETVYALRELLMSKFDVPAGRKFVILIDDSLQAGALLQNQFMQMAANCTLGSFDLREMGCIGIIMTDNDSLTETAGKRDDVALLDRFLTITVTDKDLAWKEALAAKFPTTNLTEVFNIRASMPTKLRTEIFTPRCMEHVLWNLINGNPGIWGVPLVKGQRGMASRDGSEAIEKYEEYISKIASAIGAPNPDRVPDAARRVIRQAIANNWTVLLQGKPGVGKTEVVKDVIRQELNYDPMKYYWSMSTTDVETLTSAMVLDGRLSNALRADFYDDGPKAFIIDEVNRPKDAGSNAKIMELTQEKTLAGLEIPGLTAIIAIQNPPVVMGRKLATTNANIAQQDRYFISIELDTNDIASGEWLMTKFPDTWVANRAKLRELEGTALSEAETASVDANHREKALHMAETVLEWWKNDIDDDAREWVSPRCLTRIIELALHNATSTEPVKLPLESALIYDKEGAPVSLAGLHARIKENPLTGIVDLAFNQEQWVERLKASAEADATHGSVDANIVHDALLRAEVAQLEMYRDTVMALFDYIPTKYRLAYVSTLGERQKYWLAVLSEFGKKKEAEKAQSA